MTHPTSQAGRSRRRVLAGLAGLAAGLGAPGLRAATGRPGAAGAPGPATSTVAVDAGYPPGFTLPPITAQPIPKVERPRTRAAGLEAPSYVDPVHRTRVYLATAPGDFPGATYVRHDYSRRQAFNADNSRYLAMTSNGYWLLYDGATLRPLPRGGTDGALAGLAGDAEAVWHPTDPRLLFHGDGLAWYQRDVETDRDTPMADFRGRLPWPGATQVWTKAEGTSSADGRYWAFMATSYDAAAQRSTVYGLLTYDRVQDRILGTLDASRFGGVVPDHISMSPSGRWAVPSWAYMKTLGTRAYAPDFSGFRTLHDQSEHSDLALGPRGEDVYVWTDYTAGALRARDLATGTAFDLLPLYPRPGSGYAAHVSGQAFGRPGWVVVSTYADTANYGAVSPDPQLAPMHRKVMLLELRPGGRRLGVAHTRTGAAYGGYVGEPQATVSRDGTRILFATNFDDGGPPGSHLVLLPDSVYAAAGR